MIRYLSALSFAFVLAIACAGCSSDEDDSTQSAVPFEPPQALLDAGPELGKSYLLWNSVGLQMAQAAGYEVSGWCYAGQEVDIAIPNMLGLQVFVGSLPTDSLQCTIQVTDTGYTQTEYLPEGIDWDDSVAYWVDSTVVEWPAGVADGNDISFYWYNRESGGMVQVATSYQFGRWKAMTKHFSRYILGQKRTAS